MNYKSFLVAILCFSFAIIQISCKENIFQKKVKPVSSKHVIIDSLYQKNEIVNSHGKRLLKSVIHFSNKYNSIQEWRYSTKLESKEAFLESSNILSNGNIVNVIYSGTKRFVLVLDKNGDELFRNDIIFDEFSEYDFRQSWIADNYNGDFTFYVRKEIKLGNEKQDENTRYDLEKIIFKGSKKGYISETFSIRRVLLYSLQRRGFDFQDNYFTLYFLRNKIFIQGVVKNKSESEFSYLAMFDDNFKLLKLNVLEDYQNTFIYDFSLYNDNCYYINATKVKETDLFITKTIQRIIVDENLKVIEDHSDKRTPYWDSFKRSPQTPQEEKMFDKELEESSEEEMMEHARQKHNTMYNLRGNTCTVIDSKNFYSNKDSRIYILTPKGDTILFEKSLNDKDVWQIQIKFPQPFDKEDIIGEGLMLIERDNGDVVLLMKVYDLSMKNNWSTVIFVINKQGRIIRQFEALGASTLVGARESKGKLIVNYIRNELYIKKKWKGSRVFYSEAYSLD